MSFLETSTVSGWSGFRSVLEATQSPGIVVVGVPSDLGAAVGKGAALGPDRIREISKSMKSISRTGYDLSSLRIHDLGNVKTKGLYLEQLVGCLYEVYNELFELFQCPILTLGGDHSITFPIVKAARAGRRIGLVWFDAHPDVLDLCYGSRWSHGSPVRRIIEAGVHATDILLVGTRAYDQAEPEFIDKHGIVEIRAVEFFEDYSNTVGRFISQIERLSQYVDKLYVSIDIDVLDDCHVPGTGTPVSGGLSSSVLLRLLSLLPCNTIGYDIVEFAPLLDVTNGTARIVKEMLLEVLAKISSSAES